MKEKLDIPETLKKWKEEAESSDFPEVKIHFRIGFNSEICEAKAAIVIMTN